MQMTIISMLEREHLFSVWERTLQDAKLQEKLSDNI